MRSSAQRKQIGLMRSEAYVTAQGKKWKGGVTNSTQVASSQQVTYRSVGGWMTEYQAVWSMQCAVWRAAETVDRTQGTSITIRHSRSPVRLTTLLTNDVQEDGGHTVVGYSPRTLDHPTHSVATEQ